MSHVSLPRICIISDERYPSPFADTQQVVKNACALARAGVPVELVIPRRGGRISWSQQSRRRELAEYYHLPDSAPIRDLLTVPATDRLRPPVKLLHGIAAPLYLKLRGFSVAYTRNLLPAALCLGLGMRLIFETYRSLGDEYPRTIGWLANLANHPRFVGVIMHSRYAAGSLENRGFPADRIFAVHNGYDMSDMEPVLTKKQARELMSLSPDRPLVVYTGNMQASKGIETVLDMAARLRHLDFLFIGGQPDHIKRLEVYSSRLGLSNTHFTGHRPVGELSNYLYAADVLIVPPTRKALKAGRTVLPIKTFTYLASGRPILAPDLPDTRELYEHNKNVWLVPPDDLEKAIEALQNLTEDATLANKLAKGALKTAKLLTWDERAKKIKAWLTERFGA